VLFIKNRRVIRIRFNNSIQYAFNNIFKNCVFFAQSHKVLSYKCNRKLYFILFFLLDLSPISLEICNHEMSMKYLTGYEFISRNLEHFGDVDKGYS